MTQNYTFRNVKEEEAEQLREYYTQEQGLNPGNSALVVEQSHAGVLENYKGSVPSYKGKLLIVVHQNTCFIDVFEVRGDGLKLVDLE